MTGLSHTEIAAGTSAERPKLPNMNEFSPGTLETRSIREVLRLIESKNGDRDVVIEAISTSFDRIARTSSDKQRRVRAGNVLIGMSQCGLLEIFDGKVSAKLTDLGKEILDEPDDLSSSDRFSRHLLQNCHGLELFDAVAMIRSRGESVSMQALREELRSRGFVVTENEVNSSKIRQWLEASGVVSEEWMVNEVALQRVIGATSTTIGDWANLSRSQRALLDTLKRISIAGNSSDWLSVRHLKKLCEEQFGRDVFPEGRLREAVLSPLQQDGWLVSKVGSSGRGGDSGQVRPTQKLLDIKVELPLDALSGIPVDLRDKLSVPTKTIIDNLKAEDTHTRGLALELLALRICVDIGLFAVCFRERSNKTQGAEVDLIANGVHLHYSRWLLQCKNTSHLEVKDIAKEVGMAVVLNAHVIVMITTGTIGRTVRDFARGLAATTSLQAILVDGDLLSRYQNSGGAAVVDWLKETAYEVLSLKRNQIQESDE